MLYTICLIALVFGQTLAAERHPWIAEARDEHWMQKHQHLVNITEQNGKDIQIVFLGDSITEGWKGNGRNVWREYYMSRHAYDYGVSGDGTQHVLYRIEHKEFDGLKPKVVVLMIGTNNIKGNTVEDIAHGVTEIVKQLHIKMSSAKILLLGVLPRAEPESSKVKQLNVLLKKLGNDKTVYYLDMWSEFVGSNGLQKDELYQTDHVHPIEAGYKVWHKTMEPTLEKLLK